MNFDVLIAAWQRFLDWFCDPWFWAMTWSLTKGLGTTLSIFFLTLLFALPLGLLVALGRMSRFAPLRVFVMGYISVMRGTPLMLQLLFFYFGPFYIFGIRLSTLGFWGIDYRFIAVILGFSLNYAAYFAEIYRSGIEAVPRGQWEASSVLGFSRPQTFFRIILPQVVKRILPPVTNEVITLVKDTSLAFALAEMEMFTIAKMKAAAHTTMTPFLVAALFYYILNFVVAAVMARCEKALSYYHV